MGRHLVGPVKALRQYTPAKREDTVRYSKSVISAFIEQTFLYG